MVGNKDHLSSYLFNDRLARQIWLNNSNMSNMCHIDVNDLFSPY